MIILTTNKGKKYKDVKWSRIDKDKIEILFFGFEWKIANVSPKENRGWLERTKTKKIHRIDNLYDKFTNAAHKL